MDRQWLSDNMFVFQLYPCMAWHGEAMAVLYAYYVCTYIHIYVSTLDPISMAGFLHAMAGMYELQSVNLREQNPSTA